MLAAVLKLVPQITRAGRTVMAAEPMYYETTVVVPGGLLVIGRCSVRIRDVS